MPKSPAAARFRLFLYLIFVVVAGTLLFIWNDLRDVRQSLAKADGESVPPLATAALIAADDPDFHQHSRFYTLQMMTQSIRGREASNPSLETQLVRFHLDGTGIWRTAREVIISALIESSQRKDAVAKAYASEVYLGTVDGDSVYGMAKGARAYFGTEPERLSPDQAASLAAAVRSPTLFFPSATSDRAVARRLEVLERMEQAGVIKPAEYERAKKSSVTRGAIAASRK